MCVCVNIIFKIVCVCGGGGSAVCVCVFDPVKSLVIRDERLDFCILFSKR